MQTCRLRHVSRGLAAAAEARGGSVYWYDRERVFRDTATALDREDIDAFPHAMGRSIGPPWQAKQNLRQLPALEATGPRCAGVIYRSLSLCPRGARC